MQLDRRSFLKSMLAAAGYAVAPVMAGNLLSNKKPVTIYDFGAGDTSDIFPGPRYQLNWQGMTFHKGSDWFPKQALVGNAFWFEHAPHDHLTGLYVWDGSQWLLIAVSRTQSNAA